MNNRDGVAIWLFLVVLVSSSVKAANNNDIQGVLRPHQSLQDEKLPLGSEALYKLEDLSPESVYSVRLSYPSSEPTLFEIEPIELATSGGNKEERSEFAAGTRGLRDTAIGE